MQKESKIARDYLYADKLASAAAILPASGQKKPGFAAKKPGSDAKKPNSARDYSFADQLD